MKIYVDTLNSKKQLQHSDGNLPPSLRAIELLEFVAARPGELSLTELSEQMSMAKSTVHRLADQLVQAGYLYREPDQRRFWIGRHLRNLSLSVMRNDFVRSSMRDALSHLAEEVGETCNLASLDGTEIIYLQRIEARWPLRFSLDLDSRIPVHCCASGKLFLAMLPKAMRSNILKRISLEPVTERTIRSESVLEEELEIILKRGYSLDNQEFIPGMVAIAYPIFNEEREIRATLSIHSPTVRCHQAQDLVRWVPLLQKTAIRIEELMRI